MADHKLMGGKLHLYKRDRSRYWQCSTYLGGRDRRTSTKLEGLAQAKDFAEDWYLESTNGGKSAMARHSGM
jgi:hypothetical protein